MALERRALLRRLKRQVQIEAAIGACILVDCRFHEHHATGAPHPARVALCVSLELECPQQQQRENTRPVYAGRMVGWRRTRRHHWLSYLAAPLSLPGARRGSGESRLWRLDRSQRAVHRRLPGDLSPAVGSLQCDFRVQRLAHLSRDVRRLPWRRRLRRRRQRQRIETEAGGLDGKTRRRSHRRRPILVAESWHEGRRRARSDAWVCRRASTKKSAGT